MNRERERRTLAPVGTQSHIDVLSCLLQCHNKVLVFGLICSRTRELLDSYLFPLCLQYDAVPIQSSVVLCSCPSPSMVRSQTESSSAPGIPSGVSRQGPTMDGTTAEARPSTNPLQQHPAQLPPQPRKKRPEDFKFGKILGEGSFSTVSMCLCCCCLLSAGFSWDNY